MRSPWTPSQSRKAPSGPSMHIAASRGKSARAMSPQDRNVRLAIWLGNWHIEIYEEFDAQRAIRAARQVTADMTTSQQHSNARLTKGRTPMSTRILAMVGSLRANSYNRQLAEAAVKLAPKGVEVELYEGLADVPFYNEDLDQPNTVPPAAHALRCAVSSADALLLVTPEYNGTVPPALKNAIDWASRPQPQGAIYQKPVVVIGTAGGRYGGAWAHDDARKTARIAGATVLEGIGLSVPRAATRFADTTPVCDKEIITAMPTLLTALASAARTPSPN